MDKKRILIVIGSFKIGGAERMAINVGEQLNKSFDVHYVLQRPIFQIPNKISKDRIHLLNEHMNANKYILHFKSFLGIFFLRLKLRPNYVIGFTYFSSFLACFSFCRNTIARFDINPYLFAKKRHRAASFTSKWPLIKKIIVPSSGIAEKLELINKEFRTKTHVIHNAIDFKQVNDLANKPVEIAVELPDFPYITAMGRLTFQKNFPLLINTYAKSAINKNYNLVIIGDGDLKSELLQQVDNLGLSNKIFFTGFMKNPYPIIRKSRFFVNTSDFESFCNVILEALSLSKMVVASNCVSGPSEMVIPDYNGFLFEPGNERELIEIFDLLSNDKSKLEELEVNAVQSTKKFHLNEIGKKWENLFNSL